MNFKRGGGGDDISFKRYPFYYGVRKALVD